jgi:hypothetical protein
LWGSREGAAKHEKKKIRAPYVALALLGEKRFEKTIVEAAKAAGAGRPNGGQDGGK